MIMIMIMIMIVIMIMIIIIIIITFDEGERFLMQSKSTFLEFLRGIHRYKFGLPKKFSRGEIIQGE